MCNRSCNVPVTHHITFDGPNLTSSTQLLITTTVLCVYAGSAFLRVQSHKRHVQKQKSTLTFMTHVNKRRNLAFGTQVNTMSGKTHSNWKIRYYNEKIIAEGNVELARLYNKGQVDSLAKTKGLLSGFLYSKVGTSSNILRRNSSY